MKTIIKMFGLLFVSMTLMLVSCGDDDKDEPQDTSSLIGSVWKGVNPHTDYKVEVEVMTDSECRIKIWAPNSTSVSYSEDCIYHYNEETGNFRVEDFDGDEIKGYIKGKTMTLTYNEWGTFDLKRAK